MTRERPIIFSAQMVRAILDGRKTQTRRVVNKRYLPLVERVLQVNGEWVFSTLDYELTTPYGELGDLLWVREAWAQRLDRDHLSGSQLYANGVREAWYWADGVGKCCRTGCAGAAGRVRAAFLMPRWASRITLKVTGIRVERLHDISAADIAREGAEDHNGFRWHHEEAEAATDAGRDMLYGWWRALWESVNGPDSWGANPWVWVIEFKRVKP